ncbi:UDP-2,3-diacylglucosamine diphosphatase [Amphritea sp. 2_MG-2023]|uniref:UDP-2,3-diacylglucosamine diphosphatase n=1 Tax=Amphritea TaxID=515417 RepID=UPI001C07E4E0|nr:MULTISPECIES: UDP-2,3-diacylglucosamine diphosphatase [Amphritea]MBU2964417.1 UDP-2,3-diacylglucosamine diphosphatase [Amphritea atlantica]MDO6417745.1 UDP-2,3-diacylglucosamine diphosphatase [Amphritea sp. 2_MG-2023]
MRILFISDLHLHSGRSDLTRALLHFLATTAKDCDQLYILGDLFEAWIGDDFIPDDLQPVIDALKTLSNNGCQIFFQHGNRDFLIGERFAQLTGVQLLQDSVVISLASGPTLLMHGDQLCTDDVEYQALRQQLRSPEWQNALLAQSIPERLEMAKQLRMASKTHTANKSAEIMDVNPHAVEQAMSEANCQLLIHGHTHRPAVHQLNDGKQRIVLGDWDKSGWYLEASEQGEQLIKFDLQ